MGDFEDEQEGEPRLNLTGFLFGNIDENGQLEDDVLDEEAKQHLASLGRLGLGSLLSEMMTESSSQIKSEAETGPDSDEDYHTKSPTALDFSDINELADDDQDITLKSETDYDADDEDMSKLDTQLMPPPAPVQHATAAAAAAESTDEKENLTPEEIEAARQRKLETPLASMLPSKYANIKVTELFSDFRPNKVLRFSRLFGPGKPSSLPQVWRGANRRKKKKRKHHEVTRDSDSDELDQDERRVKFKGWIMNYGPTPSDDGDKVMSDDESKLLKPREDKEQTGKPDTKENGDMGPKTADWRYGPAQYWYDRFNFPENGEEFNYGFKLAAAEEHDESNKEGGDEGGEEQKDEDEKLPDDAFLMVSQLHWEDDVVWNGDEIKHKVTNKLNRKINAAGWVPSNTNRTAQVFSQPGKGGQISIVPPNVRLTTATINTPLNMQSQKSKQQQQQQHNQQNKTNNNNNQQQQQQVDENYDDTWYSIFPVENEELVYGLWEEEVIWDPMNMKKIPKPKILTLDPNDENIVLGIPEDIDPKLAHKVNGPQPKVKIPHPHVKKSKLLLGKAGVISTLEEDAPPPPPKSPNHDPFNISNDMHYMPRSSETTLRIKVGGGNLIQHSTPVVELRAPFIQTHMGPLRLRNFHRTPLKRYSHGTLANPGPHLVQPLLKNIKKKAKQREQERIASGGGDVFFMRTPEDLSGKDGEIVLVEFSEEHPPLINQVGMCSKFKNYYKRRPGNDYGPKKLKYGETAYAHTTPFLGVFTPGQTIQAIENNMYRAPIYQHNVPQTDFLVIRTRQHYFIREIDGLYVAGQECPLYEVPGPNSKRANNFVRDFLQVFIYRLFWKSTDTPRRIKMDDIKTAFPSHSESSIRKRLKLCADFKRTGMDSNWWVIKPEFRLPNEEEIRGLVSPEQCCAYFSMIAAEQRLKDAGYGEKFLFTTQDDDDEEIQGKMEDEVKVAPWNTTRAYIQAMKGKCLLQLTGPADPTGQGEGFSYIRVPNKPTVTKEEQESQPKRTVTGTDADLRRLQLRDAKAILRKNNVPEDEIKKLSRWEVIDVVRTLSTEKAKAGEEGMNKFSRGNRFSIAEHQERYKEECQRIFDLQNRVLASSEILSTDDGESYDDDSSEIEEMGKNLENMLANKKTSVQLSLEKEEQGRQELIKMMDDNKNNTKRDGDNNLKQLKDKKKDGVTTNTDNYTGDENSSNREQIGQVSGSGGGGGGGQGEKILKITRTFCNAEGEHYTRIEIVRKPAIIDAYVKIRNSKDESLIKQYTQVVDDRIKEELKRERRRVQEQLRRIKRNQERGKIPAGQNLLLNSSSSDILADRSNKLLSSSSLSGINNGGGISSTTTTAAASTSSCSLTGGVITGGGGGDSTESNIFSSNNSFGSNLLAMKGLKSDNSPSKRKKPKLKPDLKLKCGACGNVGHMRTNKACPAYQSGMSSGGMPSSGITHHLSGGGGNFIMNDEQDDEMEKSSSSSIFLNVDDQELVNVEGTKVKLASKRIQMIDMQNAAEDMKRKSLLLKIPKDSVNSRKRRRAIGDDHCDYLKRHQKPANRRRTDPAVVMATILETILNEMRDLPEVQLFLFPVNAKKVPDYYNVIVRPMDLQTIRENLRQKKYSSRKEFLEDVNQIVENSSVYNGPKNALTLAAQNMLNLCVERLGEKEDKLMRLEKEINPLLDDNDQVALSYILDQVIDLKIKSMPEIWPFLKPVNKKQFKDYYNVIKEPMDLETIAKKVSAHKYQSRHEFLRDIELILDNCTLYNGKDSPLVSSAKQLFEVCRDTLDEYDEPLSKLESSVAKIKREILVRKQNANNEKNYTIPESDSMANSPDNSHYNKSTIDDYDFVDVESDLMENEHMSQFDINYETTSGSGLKTKDVLEEDLQFSSEDDDFHEVPSFGTTPVVAAIAVDGDGNNPETSDIDQVFEEMRQPPQAPIVNEDDSQQAAEAMVQLGNAGFYIGEQQLIQQEESMDVDPNYDPSDFLLAGLPPREANTITDDKIHDDLAVSESDEEVENRTDPLKNEQSSSQPDEDVGGDIWF